MVILLFENHPYKKYEESDIKLAERTQNLLLNHASKSDSNMKLIESISE